MEVASDIRSPYSTHSVDDPTTVQQELHQMFSPSRHATNQNVHTQNMPANFCSSINILIWLMATMLDNS